METDIEGGIAWLVAKQYRGRARQNVVVGCKPNVATLRERPKLKIVEASESCPLTPPQDEREDDLIARALFLLWVEARSS